MVEQHPVPQNVTTFQFRLIGDMTLKQFAYLAGGAILGYIAYHLPLPFFFTWPLTALFALGGIGFAFVPVEERPMDVWFVSFIKSVYSPTLYIWQRDMPSTISQSQLASGTAYVPPFPFSLFSKKASQAIPQTTPSPISTTATSSSNSQGIWKTFFAKKKNPVIKPLQQAVVPPRSVAPSILASSPIAPIKQPVTPITPIVPPLPTPVPYQPPQIPPPTKEPEPQQQAPTNGLEKKLEEALQDKKRLEEELMSIKQLLMSQQNKPSEPQVPENTKPVVPYQPPPQRSPANVISGVIRQQTGELLHSILVTVKDKEDIPLRALKTNKMGLFAASTPLPNGTYTIDIEDPKAMFTFQPLTITLDGKSIPPVVVIAKTKQELDRQKLSDALFGKTG